MTKGKRIRKEFIFYSDALDFYFNILKDLKENNLEASDVGLTLTPEYYSFRVTYHSFR